MGVVGGQCQHTLKYLAATQRVAHLFSHAVSVNIPLTSHAFTRAFFCRAWLKNLSTLMCLHCSISCARHLKKKSPRSHAMLRTFLVHHSRHLHRARRLLLHDCSLQIGLPLLLCCLADWPNDLLSRVMSPTLRLKRAVKQHRLFSLQGGAVSNLLAMTSLLISRCIGTR